MNTHPEHVNKYVPPKAVKHNIIKHALRKIPGADTLHRYLDHDRTFNRLDGLKIPQYNLVGKGDGSMQFAFPG